jgi:uncharacterized protein YjbJ (UPF0337 family)
VTGPGRTRPGGRSCNPTQGGSLTKDQIGGELEDAAGKVQETTGKVTGNTAQQLMGIRKQVEGQTQKVAGDIEESVQDVTRKQARDRPAPVTGMRVGCCPGTARSTQAEVAQQEQDDDNGADQPDQSIHDG